jgi:hypothetical protein
LLKQHIIDTAAVPKFTVALNVFRSFAKAQVFPALFCILFIPFHAFLILFVQEEYAAYTIESSSTARDSPTGTVSKVQRRLVVASLLIPTFISALNEIYRFREFVDLRQQLIAAFPEYPLPLPQLPPKSVLPSTDATLLQQRRIVYATPNPHRFFGRGLASNTDNLLQILYNSIPQSRSVPAGHL